MTNTLTDTSRFTPDNKSDLVLYDFLALGFVPEFLIRLGIRRLLRKKLSELRCDDQKMEGEKTSRFADELKQMPIAIDTGSANQQHYEVPAEFFKHILGPAMKYSCCLWSKDIDLKEAEAAMLELTCERADISDEQSILDLGCGWGSFSLFVAQKYRNVQVTAVSNSQSQKTFIENKARDLGIRNVSVITADINEFQSETQFDRVVSIEMFEHMKNYDKLLANIADWLTDEGKLFVHIFSHVKYQYHFDSTDPNDWLTRYFFTGGTMPSDDLLSHFQKDMFIKDHWCLNGQNYKKTAEAWLENMGRDRKALTKIIEQTYGVQQSKRWWIYWRLFFLACAETWGFDGGRQWIVSHYLFQRR